jgi:RND family efflux transporter MFP subunit
MGSEIILVSAPQHGLRKAAVIGGSLVLVLVCGGFATRALQDRALREITEAQADPVVSVTMPLRGNSSTLLELPGRLQAYSQAPIYARVSGYLKNWNVDIGARVQAGQLLAVIEAPDVDQQLAQAKADLMTAQANAALAGTTATRWHQLFKTDSVSEQDVDMKDGDFAAKQAIAKAAKANLDRLQVLQGFTNIVAPFSGIITARRTDVGALINVGSSAGQELFVVSDTHQLRLYVNVPERYSARIEPGTKAQLSVPALPGRTFTGVVRDDAGAIDPASGTTLVQIDVDNTAAQLTPGSFAVVRFSLPPDTNDLRVPSSAIIFDSKGLRIATLGPDNRAVLKSVTVGRDLGEVIGVSAGLLPTDRVIDSPPDGIATGDTVRVAPVLQPPGV